MLLCELTILYMVSLVLLLAFDGAIGDNLAAAHVGQFLILVAALTLGLVGRFEEPS